MSKKYGQPEYEVPDNKTERGRNMQRGQGYGMNSIFHRISVRKYEDRPIEKEKIMEILRAGMQAPSACNQQPWEFYVTDDKMLLQELSKTSPYAGLLADAPQAIITAYRKDCKIPEYAQIDMSIAMENMWLATDQIGLGGV